MNSETSAPVDEAPGAPDSYVPTFSPDALGKAENALAVYTDASRSILLNLCERLGRLELVVRTVQNDVFRLRSDITKGTSAMKDEVAGVHGHVQTLSHRLGDVTSVVTLMQTEIIGQRNSVSALPTFTDDDRARLDAVDLKVDNQRDEFASRLYELNLKLEEIPRALAALQKPGAKDPFAGFTFRTAERDKLSLGTHMTRAQASGRPGGPPFTDLQPFTIPDDMKDKIEVKIRQKEASKMESDRRAAVELAAAYKRLQLAGYPRVTEIHMHVEQCREEIKRAFEYIQLSNLQLYSCCESKVEREDMKAIQMELRALRDKVRDFDLSTRRPGASKMSHAPESEAPTKPPSQTQQQAGLSAWSLDKYVHTQAQPDERGVHVMASQVPELRVSLLEMSRNVNAMRQQWSKKHIQPINPVAKQHLERLVALLNDAYSTTAEEPVDLDRVARYVEKIANLIGTDFSQHIFHMMLMNDTLKPQTSVGNTCDVVGALDGYARAFNEAIAGSSGGKGAGTHHATTMRVISDQKKQLDQLREGMEKLSEAQRTMEATLASSSTTGGDSDGDRSATTALRFAAQQHQLLSLQDELAFMRRQSMQQEEAFTELARQFDQWRKERAPIGALIGQRMSGAPLGAQSSSLSSSLRRSNSGNVSSELDAYVAITGAIDHSERPKSQAKLDPLHVQRVGDAKPATGRAVVAPVARNGMLHKIQTRAQASRPKSGVHHTTGDS